MSTLITDQNQNRRVLAQLNEQEKKDLAKIFLSFLDGAATATGRATFYNSKEEQVKAIKAIHKELFGLERGIYAMALMLPGFTDYSKQLGVVQLLNTARTDNGLLDSTQEAQVILNLFNQLSVPRKLKLFVWLKAEKINNARTRKLILRSLLEEKKLELWSVKYRSKLKSALQHAWGKRTTSIIKSILEKPFSERTTKEKGILKNNVLRYTHFKAKPKEVLECIAFILGVAQVYHLGLFKAHEAAKQNLEEGQKLPFEVLEGIRSTYHKEVPPAKVLELTKSNLTTGQRLAMQAKGQKEKVEIKFNPLNYDAVKLYIYAYKQGLTPEITEALSLKAQKSATALPIQFGKIGLLLDNSQSMMGDETQYLRPMAITLAVRDVLKKASKECIVANDVDLKLSTGLVTPSGDTALAMGLVELLEANVEQIFILSDGYENTPAGRVDEVLQLARKMGIQTPVFQVSPVMGAESNGLRKLSESITGFPINNGNGLGIGLLKAMFEVNLEKGIEALMNTALPLLDSTNKIKTQ